MIGAIQPYASQPYVPNYDYAVVPDNHLPSGNRVEKKKTGWSAADTIAYAPAPYNLLSVKRDMPVNVINLIPANAIPAAPAIPSTQIGHAYIPQDKIVAYVANSTVVSKRTDAQINVDRPNLDVQDLNRLCQHIAHESKRVEHCHEMLGLLKV